MEQNNQRNSRKRLNSLILLVAFTAVMLIVSTYAWFSTQKNVTLGGLEGKVNVAEGLQISLDALNWKNEIDLSETGIAAYFAQTNADAGLSDPDEIYNLVRPYATAVDADNSPETYHNNIIPGELLPASTIASDSIGETDMTLYRGENTDGIVLSDIHEINSTNDTEIGYFAIDFFLQNSSSETVIKKYNDALTAYNAAVTGNDEDEQEAQLAIMKSAEDVLRLETNTSLTLKTAGKESTGLQNTLRTAFVLFENANTDLDAGTSDTGIIVANTPSQRDILSGTAAKKIKDVSIWEPNASGTGFLSTDPSSDPAATTGYPAHVNTIYQTNNRVTFSSADRGTFGIADTNVFTRIQALPTYALTAASVDAEYTVDSDTIEGIANIYDWDITDTADSNGVDDVTGLAYQHTLQTTTDGVTEVEQLYSAKDGTTTFSIAPGQYHKLRMYVWLEGQDVDCINYASLGGGIVLDVGLSKPGTTQSGS